MSGRPDFRDGPRHKADAAEWLEIRAAKVDGQRCRICNVCVATEAAHLVPKGRKQEGDDVAENIVGLCVRCHDLVDTYEPGACATLRRSLTRPELEYIVRRKGRPWLDKRFPYETLPEEGAATGSSHLNTVGTPEPASNPGLPPSSESVLSGVTCDKCGRRYPALGGKKPTDITGGKKTVSLAVPKAKQLGQPGVKEDGAVVLAQQIRKCGAELGELGYDENSPPYNIVIAVTHDWLELRGEVQMLREALAVLAQEEAA